MASSTNIMDQEEPKERSEMEPETSTEYLPDYPSPEIYFQTLLKKMVECTQKSNNIASSADDYEFWSSYPEYSQFCMQQAGRIRHKIVDLLHHQGVPCRWSDTKESSLSTGDIEEKYEHLIEANDGLLERVDYMLDEAAGLRKDHKPIMSPYLTQNKRLVVSAWNKKAEKAKNFKLLLAKNIQRPQLKWLETIDNSNTPFVPLLKEKPNALKPWKPVSQNRSYLDEFLQQQRSGSDENIFASGHPYHYELEVFEPAQWQLEDREPQAYKPIEEVPCKLIDNLEGLQELNNILKSEKEFAIDLEAHSYRSFLGFVCLMQISTRENDYLVDTIELRKHLQILNESFTDPKILKVMHGADMDIGWLQRDFGLYIVNLFDTGQAARILGVGRFSLAYLLHKYCSVAADKQYQLADWRMRPLPDEMVKYAREDTHYLLYIKDRMRNELLKAGKGTDNMLQTLYTRSKTVASKAYEKPIFTPESYQYLYSKYKKPLNQQQLQCFKLLYAWRDKVAREEDESTGYILPNHMILSISEVLPREPQGVIACCNPVPPIVKQRIQEIHALVEEAKDFEFSLINDPASQREHPFATRTDTVSLPKAELKGKRRHQRIKDILNGTASSSKTGFELFPITGPAVDMMKPSLPLFENIDVSEHVPSAGEKKAALILASFRSPFELFLTNAKNPSKPASEIIEKWKTTSNNAMAETYKIQSEVDTTPQSEEGSRPTQADKSLKRKTDTETDDADEERDVVSLRDMLPSKKKKKTPPKPAKVEASSSDPGSGAESPVITLSYEKTRKERSFVPFDYSKSDLKKFSASNKAKQERQIDTTQLLEEPKRKNRANGAEGYMNGIHDKWLQLLLPGDTNSKLSTIVESVVMKSYRPSNPQEGKHEEV